MQSLGNRHRTLHEQVNSGDTSKPSPGSLLSDLAHIIRLQSVAAEDTFTLLYGMGQTSEMPMYT